MSEGSAISVNRRVASLGSLGLLIGLSTISVPNSETGFITAADYSFVPIVNNVVVDSTMISFGGKDLAEMARDGKPAVFSLGTEDSGQCLTNGL